MRPVKMHRKSASYSTGALRGYAFEKQGIAPLALLASPAFWPAFWSIAGTLGWVGGSHLLSGPERKRNAKYQKDSLKAIAEQNRAISEQSKQTKRLRQTGTAALGGGAVGMVGSNLWGKINNAPSLQRDLISAVVGAGLGAGAQELSSRSKKQNT